ncbi:alpha-ribazole phosphatase family protein [uncultured Sphingomonas sp.]|uniref:alpha-ribazole phosphatase family protein n=1 Tax=uncultured Sphingomonas sp. TaxID=158754 RepID=UPI0035C9DF41
MGLILLRHTRPAVAAGVCYGATDFDCADSFADDAAAASADLPRVDRILTSPLRRCRRLAQFVADATGLVPHVDDRFAEMDFGAWEGRRWDDLPRDQIDGWAIDFHHARAHGGESVAIFSARVAKALADACAIGGTTLVVTHNGVIRAALAQAGREDAWRFTLPYGGRITI